MFNKFNNKILLILSIFGLVLIVFVEWGVVKNFINKKSVSKTQPIFSTPPSKEISDEEFNRLFLLDVYIPEDAYETKNTIRTFSDNKIWLTKVFQTKLDSTKLLAEYQAYFKNDTNWQAYTQNSKSSDHFVISGDRGKESISVVFGKSSIDPNYYKVEIIYVTQL